MPPKQRVYVEKERYGRTLLQQQPEGFLSQTYSTLTAPENASVVRSVAIFGVAVAFISSSFSEYILPPL